MPPATLCAQEAPGQSVRKKGTGQAQPSSESMTAQLGKSLKNISVQVVAAGLFLPAASFWALGECAKGADQMSEK